MPAQPFGPWSGTDATTQFRIAIGVDVRLGRVVRGGSKRRSASARICIASVSLLCRLCIAAQLDRTFFNRIRQYRRAATRYDKLEANDLASIELASICIW